MISTFEKLCDEGDGNSCLLSGTWFSDGMMVSPDDKKAITFYEKGCNLNDFESCCNLGYRYENGQGVEQDYVKAIFYYKKACEAGWECGCNSLARLADMGIFANTETVLNKYIHPVTGIVFEDRIGELKKIDVDVYDDPRLGIAARYSAIGIASTIYVYTLGVESISSEPFSYEILDQFYQTENDVMNIHKDANISISEVVELGDKNKLVLHEKFEFIEDNIKKYSHLYIWGYKNNFVKIRFSYDSHVELEAEEELKKQLLYMSQYISEGTLTYEKGLTAYEQKDLKVAFMIWAYLVKNGDAASKYGLAIVYMSLENTEHSLYWLNKSAEEGYPMAQYDLGQTYCDGDLVEKDMHKCAYWIKKAKDNGYEESYDIWNELSLGKYIE